MAQGAQGVLDRAPAADVPLEPAPDPTGPGRRRTGWAPRRPLLAGLLPSLALALMVLREGAWRSADGRLHWTLFDDVMISMSYARTLAETGELVWFAGAPRTEGMTNLGWTLVMALLHRLGLSGDAVVLTVVGLGLVVVWATALQARTTVGLLTGASDPMTRFLSVLAVATCFPLLWWALRGMEVGLLVLLSLVAVNATLRLARDEGSSRRDVLALGAAVFLGIVIRSDFVVVAGGLVAWLGLRRPSRRPLRLAAGIGAVTVLTTAATVAFRLVYYGDPVPNTYFLKLAGFALGARLDRGLVVTAVTVAGYLAAPLVVIALGRRRLGPVGQDGARLLGLLAGLSALYGVSAGGDAWEYFLIPNRYLTPSLVLLLVLAVAVLRAGPSTTTITVGERRGLGWVVVLAACGPAVVYLTVLEAPRPDLSLVALAPGGTWLGVALPVLIVGLVVGLWLWRSEVGRDRVGVVMVAVLTLAGAVAAPSLAFGGIDRAADYSVLGEQIAAITEPEARVAVVAAGATQYVSRRPAVDLLGKSDERISKAPPATDALVLPGHNKYDFAYSIGELQPDVVAQPWRELAPADLLGWGYLPYRLARGTLGEAAYAACGTDRVLWVRSDSSAIRWDRLAPVDPGSCS